MVSADDNFFPAVFVASVGRERGVSEEQISEALERLKRTLAALEECLTGREYLADGFSLSDVAHAGNFIRLRELEEEGELSGYPNVVGWIERIEARESFKAAG
jgi:glutathione S-transferase